MSKKFVEKNNRFVPSVVKQGNYAVSKTKKYKHKNYDTVVQKVTVTYYTPKEPIRVNSKIK